MDCKITTSLSLLYTELLAYFFLRVIDFIFTMIEWDKEPTYEDVASNIHYWYLALAYFSLFVSLLATYLFMKATGSMCKIELHVSDTIALVLLLLYTLVALGILTAASSFYPQIVSNQIAFVVLYLLLTFLYFIDNHEEPKWRKVINKIVVISVLVDVIITFGVGIVKEVTSTADSGMITSMYLLYLLNNLLIIEYIDLGIRIMYPHHAVESFQITLLRAHNTLREYKQYIQDFIGNEPLLLTGNYFANKSNYEAAVIIQRRFAEHNGGRDECLTSLGDREETVREILQRNQNPNPVLDNRMDNLIGMFSDIIQVDTIPENRGATSWCELFFASSFLFVLVVFFVIEVSTLVLRYFIFKSGHTYMETITFQLTINVFLWLVFVALLPFLFYARRQATDYFYNEIDYRHLAITFILYWLALVTFTVVGVVAHYTENGEVTFNQIFLDISAYTFIMASMIVFQIITKQLRRHLILFQFTSGIMWIILALVGTFVLLVVIQNFYNDADETLEPNENAWTYAHAVLEVLLLLQVLHLCCETKANLSRNSILEKQKLMAILVEEQYLRAARQEEAAVN